MDPFFREGDRQEWVIGRGDRSGDQENTIDDRQAAQKMMILFVILVASETPYAYCALIFGLEYEWGCNLPKRLLQLDLVLCHEI